MANERFVRVRSSDLPYLRKRVLFTLAAGALARW